MKPISYPEGINIFNEINKDIVNPNPAAPKIWKEIWGEEVT